MKSRVISAILLTLLICCYLAFVFGSAALLPERVASHFGVNGEADGWMTRSGYLWFIAGIGIAVPLFIIGICFLTRFFPVSLINVPHKAFWLAPERREMALAFLFDSSLWLGCLIIVFFGAIHYVTVAANRNVPVRLPSNVFLPVLLFFILGIGIWTFALYRRFPKPR